MKAALALALWSAISLFLAPLEPSPKGGDWPHWRGPMRNSIIGESSGWQGGAWAAGEPLWSASVGAGSTSPLVIGGRLYTMGWQENQEHVQCMDAATGKVLWKNSYNAPQYGRHAVGDQGFYSGPSATPEYDPKTGYLYTLGADGDLNCWNTRENGKKVWGLNLYATFPVARRPQATARGGTLRDYGYTTAPLVHGDWVIVEVGSAQGNLTAFSKATGKPAWNSESKTPAGHSGGPAPITVEGVPCVAVLTMKNLLVARLDKGNEGKTVAEYEWITDFDANIPTPTVVDNHVVITSAYNKQATSKVKITLKGAEKVWQVSSHSRVCSPVVYKGHVYFASRGLHCLDWNTGELKWHGGPFGDASSCVVTGDGRLIVWANEGDLALVETAEHSPAEYKELALRKGLGQSEAWPHVAVAGGRVYCKDRAGNLKCLSLRSGGK